MPGKKGMVPVQVIEEVTRKLPVGLSQEMQINALKEFSELSDKIEGWKETRRNMGARWKADIKSAESRMADLSKATRDGTIEEDVICQVQHDYNTGERVVVRTDTNEIVDKRPLNEDERQMGLAFQEED